MMQKWMIVNGTGADCPVSIRNLWYRCRESYGGKKSIDKVNTIIAYLRCGEYEIERYSNYRQQGTSYKCKKCRFVGP